MDREYLRALLSPLEATKSYRPKLGQGGQRAVSAAEFQKIFGEDPFYQWMGLDLPEVYIAHRVAGGITSLYRQLGIGCERLLRKILRDTLDLSELDLRWGYSVEESGRTRRINLDAHISLAKVANPDVVGRVRNWINAQRQARSIAAELTGVVFEIRQGYKSKDSKRQNADIISASRAYQNSLLPCMLVLSQQIDSDVRARYHNAGWVILTGSLESEALVSTYAFMKDVIGYDLAAFFERNQEAIRQQVHEVVRMLFQGEDV